MGVNAKAVVIHSGGMDSSLCLKLAIEEFGRENVTALCFDYQQRNRSELQASATICERWQVKRKVFPLSDLKTITKSALLDPSLPLEEREGKYSAWVVGRNGLMLQLGGVFCKHTMASTLWTGVMEHPESNSGYPDCSTRYIRLKETLLQIDLDDPNFTIRTPLIAMSKLESFTLAQTLGILDFLVSYTVSCYEGVPGRGCGLCASCILRNRALIKLNYCLK